MTGRIYRKTGFWVVQMGEKRAGPFADVTAARDGLLAIGPEGCRLGQLRRFRDEDGSYGFEVGVVLPRSR